MHKFPLEYLKHISDECVFIINELEKGLGFNEFLNDELLKRAFVRSLEIIGEASKKIPIDFKLKWEEVEWKAMSGMRDKLIHDYMGVDYYIVWDVVSNKIPSLYRQINHILENEQTSSH
jgi:uncharacterized protein with HEPN domain